MPEIQRETTIGSTRVVPEKEAETIKTVEFPKVVPEEQPLKTFRRERSIFRANQAVWYVLWVIEVLLFFRMFFKIIGADPLNLFAQLLYGFTDVFVFPFTGLVGTSVVGNSIIEWPTFIAAIMYAVLAYFIVLFMQFVKPVTPEEVDEGIQ